MKKSDLLRWCLFMFVLGFIGLPLQADFSSGDYSFEIELGPYNIIGAFPYTHTTGDSVSHYGTLTITDCDVKGNLTGRLSLDGRDYSVSGKVKFASKSTMKLVAEYNGDKNETIKISAVLEGVSFVGAGKVSNKSVYLPGKAVVGINLSSAPTLAGDVLLDLSVDDKGTITGTGTLELLNFPMMNLSAAGKSKGTLKVLKIADTDGLGFKMIIKGPESDATFKAKAFGASASATVIIAEEMAPEFIQEIKPPDSVFPVTFSFDPPTPAGGSEATLTVDAPDATSIQVTATGAGCGDFSSHDITATGSITQTVGDFGDCSCIAEVMTPSGTETYRTSFTVEPTELDLPSLQVPGAVFYPGELPPATDNADDPDIASITAPGGISAGGTAEMRIQLADPSQALNVTRAFVQPTGAAGYDGYYEAPVRLANDGQSLIVEVRLDRNFTGASASQRFLDPRASDKDIKELMRFEPQRDAIQRDEGAVSVLISLLDIAGNISQAFTQAFSYTEVTTGQTTITLSWDNGTDVDLYCIEPDGTEIYYGNTSSSSGGFLDHDSTCSNYQGAIEHITWPDGAPPGEYTVKVNFYSDCAYSEDDEPQGANWTITVDSCGEVQTFSGSYSPGSDVGGSSGAGQVVTTFTSNCNMMISGKATYADHAPTKTGLSSTSNKLPIRFAEAAVVRAYDDEPLGDGTTAQDGTFEISFQDDDPATGNQTKGYYVLIYALGKNDIVDQKVVDKNGDVYALKSEVFLAENLDTINEDGLALNATKGHGGEAFNIYDMGVIGTSQAKKATGSIPVGLTWLWTDGEEGDCGGPASCFMSSSNKISVLGSASDPDCYDDFVLLHEFGHFFVSMYSNDDSPGGSHSSRRRSDPRLAMSEAMATFFGNWCKKSSLYIDTTAAGVGVMTDVETLSSAIPRGTSDNTQTGNVSEALACAVLWDLADSTNEPNDLISKSDAVFSSIRQLGDIDVTDRGVTGVDLVDFLDAWFCLGHDKKADVRKNVINLHEFNYDFADVESCQ